MSERHRLIGIRGLRKTLGDVLVLDVKSLDIWRGECVMLRGKNGSGKSTLLKIIAGLIAPDSARWQVGDAEMPWRKAVREFRKQVVYLHQTPYLFDRTVARNVAYGLKVRGESRDSVARQVGEALEWAGLADLAQRNARELSGGERQRVALTRARILSPQLLLLDEPTTGMDQASRSQTYGLIDRLADDGVTVYVSTHEQVAEVSFDRTIEIEDGNIHPAGLNS